MAPPPGAPPGYVVTSPAGVKARVNGDGGHEEEEEIVGSVGRIDCCCGFEEDECGWMAMAYGLRMDVIVLSRQVSKLGGVGE